VRVVHPASGRVPLGSKRSAQWGVYRGELLAVEAVEAVVDSVTPNSQSQYPNMAGVAPVDDCTASRGENEAGEPERV
jgi:hypothetical protein